MYRMKMNGTVRHVYDWHGNQIDSVEDIQRLDKCLQPLVNDVEYVPVWVSKGEEFIARGPLLFVQNLLRYMRLTRSELIRERKKNRAHLDKLEKDKPNLPAKLASTRQREYQERIDEISEQIAEIDNSIRRLDEIVTELDEKQKQQTEQGYASLFKHIREIDTGNRIFGGLASKGLRLKVGINGTSDTFDAFYNLKEWLSRSKDQDEETRKSQLRYNLT